MGVRLEPIGGGLLAIVGAFVLAQSLLVLPAVGLYDYHAQPIDPTTFTPSADNLERAAAMHDDVAQLSALPSSSKQAVRGAITAPGGAIRVDPERIPAETYVSEEGQVYRLHVDRSTADTDGSLVVLSAERLGPEETLAVIATEPDQFRDRWETAYRLTERPATVLERTVEDGAHSSLTALSFSNAIVDREGTYYRVDMEPGDTAAMVTLLAATVGIAVGFGALSIGVVTLLQHRHRLPRPTSSVE